jgi:hypothetical protein
MGRWERSKQLATSSWAVLKQDKELMVLPLISGVASLAVMATFLVPIFVTSQTTDALGNDTSQLGVLQVVLFFLMYAVLAYVTIFFRTALLCGADERLRGGNPSLASALGGAGRRAGRILPWALVSATVSVVLRGLEERSGLLGRLVIGAVGLAWTVVTFLVLPILVFEDVGVRDAVRRSTSLLKSTWGENLIVNGGLGLLSVLLLLPAFALFGVGIALGSPGAIVVTAMWATVWIVAVVCWSSAMSAVFQLALYRYAVDGQAPGAFATVDLGHAFAPKTKGRSLLG